jgi:putative membrane protein
MSVFATVLADTNDWNHMNGWGGGWMWLWGVAMMVLFVVLIAWFVRSADGAAAPRQNQPRDPAARAREIVAERYASGEITTEEYRERVSELQ